MPNKKKLSGVELKVLDMLPRGLAHPIQLRSLVTLTGFSDRRIYEIINGLITKVGVPIVSIRSGDLKQRGFYIATSDEERTTGLVSIIGQTKDMENRIAAVKKADLHAWQQNIIRPSIRENNQENVG